MSCVLDTYSVTMCDHMQCLRNRILAKRETINNKLPQVYIKYNVPKAIRSFGINDKGKVSLTAPARLSRVSLVTKALRSATERKVIERRNQIAVSIESHRLKGMGVGRMYADYPYHPPPTAPDNTRNGAAARATGSNFTQGITSQGSTRNGPMGSNTHQTSLLNVSDRRELKSAQTMHMAHANNLHNFQRHKTSLDIDHSNKQNTDTVQMAEGEHEQKSRLFEYNRVPGHSVEHSRHGNRLEHLKHEQDLEHLKQRHELEEAKLRDALMHPPHRSKISETHYSPYPGVAKVEYNEDFYTKGQGFLSRLQEEQNTEQEYVAFQNIKHHIIHRDEYNNSELEVGGMRIDKLRQDIPLPRKQENHDELGESFTLRDLLLRKTRRKRDGSGVTLPELNVVQITQEKNGNGNSNQGNGPNGTSTSNTALLNMNQRMNQMKAQKEYTSVQMYSQRLVRLKMSQNHKRHILPWFGDTVVVPQGFGFYRVKCPTYHNGFSVPSRTSVLPGEAEYKAYGSSSTPTVPYSTADILYGNEVNGRERQASVSDEPRQNSFGDAERTKEKRQEKDLEAPSNRRPSSKTGKQRSISIDTVTPFDKDWDKEDPLKGLSAALPPAKPSHHFRPNGIRSSSKAEQLLSAKQNGALSGRDQDDLVAMGTLWSPNGGTSQQTLPPNPRSMTTQGQSLQGYKNGTVPNNNTNSFSSKVISSSSSVNNSVVPNNTLNSQRKYSNGMRPPVLLQNNISGKKPSSSQSKEQEDPKYSDPLIGAPASFQQRIIELGALEGDTVRWERSKRLKKKKQDRDS